MGMTRLEIVNAKVSNLDINYARGLWVDNAKRVEDGKIIYEMRSRDIPVNQSLYIILKNYIEEDQVYILRRKTGDKDWNKPFNVHHIDDLYHSHGISWNSHSSRPFFKNAILNWQRRNQQIDYPVLKSLIGGQEIEKEIEELYGRISWNYKKEVIDNTFDDMLSDENETYEEAIEQLSKAADIPADKIKFFCDLLIHTNK